MKKYRIRKGSLLDWAVSIGGIVAFVLFIGLATGLVEQIQI